MSIIVEHYYVVVSRLLGGDSIGGEIVWWQDESKPYIFWNLIVTTAISEKWDVQVRNV